MSNYSADSVLGQVGDYHDPHRKWRYALKTPRGVRKHAQSGDETPSGSYLQECSVIASEQFRALTGPVRPLPVFAPSYELEMLRNVYIYDSEKRGYECVPISYPASICVHGV